MENQKNPNTSISKRTSESVIKKDTEQTIVFKDNKNIAEVSASLTVKNITALQKNDDTGIRSIQYHYINNKKAYVSDIIKAVVDLQNSLNIDQNLNIEQIKQIPDLLNKPDFYYLTIEDIILFCSQAKTGKYGKISRLDLPAFFDLLYKEYIKEKEIEIYQEQIREESKHKESNAERLFTAESNLNNHKEAFHRYKKEMMEKQFNQNKEPENNAGQENNSGQENNESQKNNEQKEK